MPNIPDTSNALLLAWFEQHVAQWEESPGAFGVPEAKIDELRAALDRARADFNAANAARLASQQATVAQNESLRAMRTLGSGIVNSMKAFIEQSEDSSLWGASGLEPVAPRGSLPPPNAPTRLSTRLGSEGHVTVVWKGRQPKGVDGVVYFIKRSLNGGPYTLLASTGDKSFTDGTVPAGTHNVAYIVTAKRGGQESPQSPAVVAYFGTRPSGTLTMAA